MSPKDYGNMWRDIQTPTKSFSWEWQSTPYTLSNSFAVVIQPLRINFMVLIATIGSLSNRTISGVIFLIKAKNVSQSRLPWATSGAQTNKSWSKCSIYLPKCCRYTDEPPTIKPYSSNAASCFVSSPKQTFKLFFKRLRITKKKKLPPAILQ